MIFCDPAMIFRQAGTYPALGGSQPAAWPRQGAYSTLRVVADGLNVVAIRVQDIATVVVGVVPRTKTWRSIVAAACGEGRSVEGIDGLTVWRGKRNVHGCRGLTRRNEEVNTPRRPEAHGTLHLGHLDSEWSERGRIESLARLHVTDGDREMVYERHGA